MGRRRQNDLGLPPRVYPHHSGGFIWKPQGAPAVKLQAETVFEACVEHGRLSKQGVKVSPALARAGSLNSLIATFRKERMPQLSPTTQAEYDPKLTKIGIALGDLHPGELKVRDINAFIYGVTQSDGERNVYISLFRNLFKIAIKAGLVESNIARDIDKETTSSRVRVPEIHELEAFKAAQAAFSRVDGEWWSCYIDLKILTALRLKDLCELPPIPLSVGVLEVEMSKSKRWNKRLKRRVGRTITIEVTKDVQDVLKRLYALKRPQSAERLLCNTQGRPYTPASLGQAFRRAMIRYLKAQGVEVPKRRRGEAYLTAGICEHELWFHEHDIRATVASADEANAQRRLGHKDAATTSKYLRDLKSAAQANPVKPISMKLVQSLRIEPKAGKNIHQLPQKKSSKSVA